jgi:hypothetical protein
MTPSAVANSPVATPISALRTNAVVNSESENARWNHRVENAVIGSVGVALLLKANTTSTSKGANKKRMNAQK